VTELNTIHEERLSVARTLLESWGLGKLYERWVKGNTGDGNAYHNNQHQLIVALHGYRLGYKFMNQFRGHSEVLFLTGLYHDYDHTGDPQKADSVNIERAVAAWRRHTTDLGIKKSNLVELLIKATQNDLSQTELATMSSTSERRNLVELIRECDYAYILEPDWRDWVHDLSTELNTPVTIDGTKEFIKNRNLRFLEFHDFLKI